MLTNKIYGFHAGSLSWQPRSQGLSSNRPLEARWSERALWGGKMRDPGNEVAILVELGYGNAGFCGGRKT